MEIVSHVWKKLIWWEGQAFRSLHIFACTERGTVLMSTVCVRNYSVSLCGVGGVLRKWMMNAFGIHLYIRIWCWELWWLPRRREKHRELTLIGNRMWLLVVEIYRGSGHFWSLWLGILVIGGGKKDLAQKKKSLWFGGNMFCLLLIG